MRDKARDGNLAVPKENYADAGRFLIIPVKRPIYSMYKTGENTRKETVL